MIRALVVGLLLVAATILRAEERILHYHIDMQIRPDGQLEVAENIKVRAEGNSIRRGIYRDFPTRYKDRYGNNVVVELQVLEVLRDGEPEAWFIETLGNGSRINTGDEALLRVPAEYTYTFRYRTTRQLGFFADHDELYWNAIGTGWALAIETGGAEVHLPAAVPVAQLHAEGYTGYQGEQGQGYRAQATGPGQARWELTGPLLPGQGFTLVLSFPKGLIAEPGRLQRAWWILKDNRGVLVQLAGLLVLLIYCLKEWRRVGRDPDPGIVIARYEPPAEHTPASLRYVRRMGYDMRCFSSELLTLAVAGCIDIEREKGFLSEEWQLQKKTSSPSPSLQPSQAALLAQLFPAGANSLVLKDSNASIVSAARRAHEKALGKATSPRYFKRNDASVAVAWIIALASTGLAYLVAGGAGIAAVIVLAAVMLATLFAFALLVRAPTAEGRVLLDEIEGLKLYLGVAERDELARMPGPDAPPLLDAGRYEMLLPYAVALEVEDAWTKKFTLAVGAAAAAAASSSLSWYHGSRFDDIGALSEALGSSLTSQISSASTPPGSSSGSGGGGSSGGGGGGGGGGGR